MTITGRKILELSQPITGYVIDANHRYCWVKWHSCRIERVRINKVVEVDGVLRVKHD